MHESALNQDGFTLAETAIVLAIVATVIGLFVPSLLSMRVAEQARATNQNLQTVMNVITGFVQSKGCIPCPTPAERAFSGGHGLVRGDDTETAAACGACSVAVGLVPFVSLGVPESFAKDGYGHWLTYAVDTALTGFVVVPPQIENGLCQRNISPSNPLNITLSNGTKPPLAAVLLLSHGANGYGAYKNSPETNSDRLAFPTTMPSCVLGGAEQCNADGDINFTHGLAAGGTNPFDDQMLYFERNALVSHLGNVPCTTDYPPP